jgi:tetratricopeptide (TPR) repeat protein
MRLTLALAFAFTASAMAPAIAQEEAKKEIVVTARSLKDTNDALRKCLERKCPPDEDIKATLAHAENQFVEGDYKSARKTVLSSLGRNRKHKGGYPEELSNLLRANANIAEHLGEADAYRLSVLDMRDVLKGAYKADDLRVIGAELEVADSRMRLGYFDEARAKYREIAKEALAFGKPTVAALADLRTISSFVQEAQSAKTDFNIDRANKAIDAFVALPPKGAERYTIVAEILRTRLDRIAGKPDSTNDLIKRYAAMGLGEDRPVLVAANPIKTNEAHAARMNAGGSDLNRMSATATEDRWVDIGFWINSDGKVEDTEILRSMGSTTWIKPVLDHINSRIYTPAKAKEGHEPGFYAVERYSLTAQWVNDNTGTRIRRRSAIPQIQRIDLSE